MKYFNRTGRTSLLAATIVLGFAAGSFAGGFSSVSLAQSEAIEAYNEWYATQATGEVVEQPARASRPGPCLSQ